jgi:hypothetical protein
MNSTRRSYEAHVLLLPLGATAVQAQDAFVTRGLEGVMTVLGVTRSTAGGGAEVRLDSVPLAGRGWRPAAGGLDVGDLVGDADMIVLLAADLAEVPAALCEAVSAAARTSGALIAALVMGSQNWDTPQGSSAMAALREAADMLVVVRGAALASSFLDVLRGGAREPVPVP